MVGHVGSFVWPKDHPTFVRAAGEIVKQVPNVRFLLVGEGYKRAEIESMVKENGLGNSFIFAGLQKDMPLVFSAMDCMLFPSTAEGFGLVVVEAQAAGVPVVVSNLPSIKEAICEPLHQLTVEPGKYIDFARNIVCLLKNPKMLANLRETGLDFVRENFSSEAAVKRLTDFYDELIK